MSVAQVTRKHVEDRSILAAIARGWLTPEIHGESLIDCIEKALQQNRELGSRLEAIRTWAMIEEKTLSRQRDN